MQQHYARSHKAIRQSPKFLWFLLLSFVMVTIFFNWFNQQTISIYGLDLNAATFILPFTFFLSAFITEIYGYKHARRAVWYALFFNLLFVLYQYGITLMPNPDYPNHNDLFDSLLTTKITTFFASNISYFLAHALNLVIIAKMKMKSSGQRIDFRFLVAISLALVVNSFTFNILTINSSLAPTNALQLAFGMWAIGNLITIMFLPILVLVINKLKQSEKIDIFDTRTYFNIFSLGTTYIHEDNRFK